MGSLTDRSRSILHSCAQALAGATVVALGIGCAHAADWRLINDRAGVRLEYDTETVEHDGPWIVGWVRATYKREGAGPARLRNRSKVLLQRVALDCDAKTLSVRTRLAYDTHGRLVASTMGRPPTAPFAAKPKTIDAEIFESACGPS